MEREKNATGYTQGYDTTGKLLCAVRSTHATGRESSKSQYGLALEMKNGTILYPCTEISEGLFHRKRFRAREWPTGSRIRVLVDESSGRIYMRQWQGKGEEIVLRCNKRVALEEWIGCAALSNGAQVPSGLNYPSANADYAGCSQPGLPVWDVQSTRPAISVFVHLHP